MAVVAADLMVIGAANMAEDDTSLQGGARAQGIKMVFAADMAGTDQIELLSSSASDVDQQYDVVGKDGAGSDVTENLKLTGTTPVVTTASYERINKVVRTTGSALVGVVTVREAVSDVAKLTLEDATSSKTGAEVTEVRKMFINLVVPGTTDKFYEKVFYHNGNAATTLTSANVQLSDASDPADTDIRQAIEDALNETATSTNRLTAPTGPTFVDNQVNQQVVDGNHTAGDSIGVWIEIEVQSTASAAKNTFNLRESGQTV